MTLLEYIVAVNHADTTFNENQFRIGIRCMESHVQIFHYLMDCGNKVVLGISKVIFTGMDKTSSVLSRTVNDLP